MIRHAALLMSVAMAALMAGCGGGADDDAPPPVMMLTDRPGTLRPLAQELRRDVEGVSGTADDVAARIIATGARVLVLHITLPAPTPAQTWVLHESMCAAAQSAGARCVISVVRADTVDQATTKRLAAWNRDGIYCDLRAVADDEQRSALVRCVRIGLEGAR